MAVNTDKTLQHQLIYSVFVRNHTPEGTFRALERDLDRLSALGTDIVWLMPIHPIGEVGRKGTLGSPYAIRDYRGANPEYGTVEDFRHLVDAIHVRGMKCIIDVVYNHTSPDSVLAQTHPEWFFRDEQGRPSRHVADWWDVVDLDYTHKELWRYQIDTLKMWAEIVDGFRCDVASSVPLDFWARARQEVETVRPGCIWLAESVHGAHVLGLRRHTRLGLETAAGAVVLVLLGAKGCLAAGITLPGVGYVDLGIAAPLLWEGLLVALAECARIADGMDGIVCGTSFAAMLGLMGVMTLLGWFPLGVLPAALAGSLMAFLLWNFPPAKLRLGSVGSLFLAGMLGCVPLCIGWPDLTLPLALPFWLEGGMVALQILVCKASRGRRQLFRSAPLHRWLELRGQSAEQIFYTFCVIAMLGVALTVQLAKIS